METTEKKVTETTTPEIKTPEIKAKTSTKQVEPLYTVAQLTESYRTFGTARSIVECALKIAGKEKFTLDEARRIIDIFKNKR